MSSDSGVSSLDAIDAGGRRSVGWLLFTIGAVVSTVIVVLSVLLSFRLSNEEAIVEDMGEVIQAVSNETVAHTESFLNPAERTVEEVSRLLERGQFDTESGLPVEQFLFETLRVNDAFDGIFIGRNDGSFLYVTRNDLGGYQTKYITPDDGTREVSYIQRDSNDVAVEEWNDPSDLYDPRTRPWFDDALSTTGEGVWTEPYVFFSTGIAGVTRSQAVSQRAGGQEVVIGVDIRLDALSDFMAERQASPNGESFIIDRRYQSVVAYPDEDRVTGSEELTAATDLGEPTVDFVADFVAQREGEDLNEIVGGSVGGEDFQFAVTSLGNNPDWIVAVTAPDDDFLARVRDGQLTTRTISVIGGLISVLLLGIGGLVVNARYRRERELARTALDAAIANAGERDSTQDRLADTVEELARSNADLEEYAYAASHDLRTPLRAIGGYAELILREAESEDSESEVAGYAEQIVAGYERMCLTMDNLLAHARASVDEPVVESVPLTPIAYEAIGDFTHEFRAIGGQIEVGDLGVAAVDPLEMGRVFHNLISNACKYRHPDRPLQVVISANTIGSVVVVEISDNGIGIAEEHQEEAFRLFSRISADVAEGNGVGLALVKKVIESHAGTISLESDSTTGTTFTIRLPVEPPASEHRDAEHGDAQQGGMVDA